MFMYDIGQSGCCPTCLLADVQSSLMRKARARGSLTIGAATVAMTMGSQAGKNSGQEKMGWPRKRSRSKTLRGVSERGNVTCLISPDI